MSLLRNRYSPQAIPSWENSCLKKVMTMSKNDKITSQFETSDTASYLLEQADKDYSKLETLIDHLVNNKISSAFPKLQTGRFKKADPLVRNLLPQCPDPDDLTELAINNEYTQVYMRAYEEILKPINFEPRYFKNFQANDVLPSTGEPIIFADLANAFVSKIYSGTLEDEFIQAQRNRSERLKHQEARAIRLLNKLRVKYSKLLVLRLDFAIAKNCRNLSEDLNLIRNMFKKFLKSRFSVNQRPTGYIWKLEYGVKKGYHYHTIFFLDGNKHQKDEIIADQFGKAWVQLTEGKGTYYSCNGSKERYKDLAIGMVHHDDEKAYGTLESSVIRYFTKDKQHVLIPSGNRLKTFGTSQMPASKRKSGRPRRGI